MKNTPLSSVHQSLGAKMVDFAGFNMPVQYAGVTEEHKTVREHVGVFDVSHMGEFLIEGPKALDLVQKISSNDATKLHIGRAQYAYMPNEHGGIVDDMIVYQIKEDSYLLVVNASNIDKDWAHITQHNTMDATMRNLSDDYALLAIQGPKAIAAMQSITPVDLSTIKFYHFEVGPFAGIENVIISATGYTGSGGFEIYCKNTEVEQVWDKVMTAGADYGIQPIGLAARDTLRLEMGYCLYGNDIDETTSPFSAGLGWVTKFTKNFVNSTALQQEKERGVDQKLVAFEMDARAIPRKGYEIKDSQQQDLGVVTSGTMSPSLGKGIGMGYVPKIFASPGSKINVQVRKKLVPATVIKLPFYKK